MARKLCIVCNVRAVGTGDGDDANTARSLGECNPCYTEGGWENSHSDEGHDEDNTDPNCWICHQELNLAKKSHTPRVTGTREQGTRRAQLSHKGHSHPQTPAARRACKELFWASVGELTKETTPEVVHQFSVGWDTQFDGKVAAQVQPAQRKAEAAKMTTKEAARDARANKNRADAAAGRLDRRGRKPQATGRTTTALERARLLESRKYGK